jgi:hypothetical protein
MDRTAQIDKEEIDKDWRSYWRVEMEPGSAR